MRRQHPLFLSNLLLALLPVTAAAQTAAQNDSAAAQAAKAKTLPLITTRTLEFTTNEGSWISLDVSPDGGAIVFELLGDLLHDADRRRNRDAHHERARVRHAAALLA